MCTDVATTTPRKYGARGTRIALGFKHGLLVLAAAISTAPQAACQTSEPMHDPASSSGPEFYDFYIFTVVPWLTDASGALFLLDTGRPRTQVLPSVVDADDDTFAEMVVPDLQLRGLPTEDVPLVISSWLPPNVAAAIAREGIDGFRGIVGVDLLGQQAFALDPREQRIVYGSPDVRLPEAVEPGIDLGARVVGGSQTCFAPDQCFAFGPTRMLVDITLNGVQTTALIDTAATFVTMTDALFGRVEQAGPTRVVDTLRVLGAQQVRERRGRVAELGLGQEGQLRLKDVAVLVADPSLDVALTRLHVETGVKVEVLLGHSVLQRYFAVVDYPAARARLHPYVPARQGRISGSFVSFGYSTDSDADCRRVSVLVLGSTIANQGLELGDCVESVDGLPKSRTGETETPELGHRITLTVTGRPTPLEAEYAEHLPPLN